MAFGSRDLSFASLHTSKLVVFCDGRLDSTLPRAGRLHFARRCDLPEAHGDDDDSVGQCRVAKAASRCVDARGRPAAGGISKDRQDAVTAREKLGEEHGSQLGDVLGSRPVLVRNDLRAPDAAADHASMPTRCTSLFFGLSLIHI